MLIKAGSTSRMVTMYAYDVTTGLPYVTAAFGDGGISLWYRRGITGAVTAITPATQTVTGAYSSGGFILLNAADNAYRFDIPDAAFAAGVDEVEVGGHATAWKLISRTVQLTGFDPRTDAVATVAGSLDGNLKQWLGTAPATPDVAGVPVVGLRYILATILTEGAAGRLAANFKTFFNVSSATGTQDVTPTTTAVTNRVTANTDQINASANAAARLALSTAQIIPGTVDTTATATTATTFESDDITEATASHYVDRLVLWTSGALAGQVTGVTAYTLNGGRGAFVVEAMTEAPANNDTFVLV